MKKWKLIIVSVVTIISGSSMGMVQAASDQQVDNTGVNERDRGTAQVTADSAGNAKSDRQAMAKIRRAVVKDSSLSTYAHNVKIIAKDGHVTLRGPVASSEEKKIIGKRAAEVVGRENVSNRLTIKRTSKE